MLGHMDQSLPPLVYSSRHDPVHLVGCCPCEHNAFMRLCEADLCLSHLGKVSFTPSPMAGKTEGTKSGHAGFALVNTAEDTVTQKTIIGTSLLPRAGL